MKNIWTIWCFKIFLPIRFSSIQYRMIKINILPFTHYCHFKEEMKSLPAHFTISNNREFQIQMRISFSRKYFWQFSCFGDWQCILHRVAKCHRYGRYICVKILEGWGKKCRRPRSFVKWSSFRVNSFNFDVVLS